MREDEMKCAEAEKKAYYEQAELKASRTTGLAGYALDADSGCAKQESVSHRLARAIEQSLHESRRLERLRRAAEIHAKYPEIIELLDILGVRTTL